MFQTSWRVWWFFLSLVCEAGPVAFRTGSDGLLSLLDVGGRVGGLEICQFEMQLVVMNVEISFGICCGICRVVG